MNIYLKKKGQDLFLKAIELADSEQIPFIHQVCQDNAPLIDYVLNLLKSHHSSNKYFEELEDSITATQLNEIEDHLFRDIDFGKYKIINVLKQGGMGTIFLAKRSDGEFEREVVIKMMPIDLSFKQSHSLFSHEKEILASLIHPNIVQLYDSGITDSGQSYFVMELVKGKTLINHCNCHKLNIKQRTEMFQEVLTAIGFAHQHLVIHGDIKPSNIMVNEEGQIRLLDFGIAKLVYKNDDKPKGYSLNYLTPEHKNKQPIITTTDIHQLGQLLFELLTNIAPKKARDDQFNFPLLSAIPEKLQDIKYNATLKYFNSRKQNILKNHHSDLQYIVAKALSINPKNRYHSTQSFADDLNRYKNKYCVTAREPTHFYRLSKYLSRNLLLSLFVLLLILGSAGFSFVTNIHNNQLALERDKALKIKNLISDIFNAADPSFIPGKELTATEVLDMGLKRVREKLVDDSDVEADLLQEIAQTYQSLGQYQKSQNILQEVFEIRLKLYPNDNIIKAKIMLLLGENSQLMSNHQQAKDWLIQSLEIFEKHKGNKAFIASVKSKLGRVLVLLGELKNAETMLLESTQLTTDLFGEKSYEYAQTVNDLNSVYFKQGKFKQVQDLLHKTKRIREEIIPENSGPILDKDYATNINNLGLAYYLQGKLIEGERYFKLAIDLRNKIYTKPHPDQAQSLNNLGLLLNDAGRPNEALPYLKQALKVRQITLNKGHMRINDAWNNLAMVYHENGDFDKAEIIYGKILPKVIEVRGAKHPQTLAIMTNRANTLMELEQYAYAHNLFKKSLTARLEKLPENHLYLSYSYIGLGRSLLKQGDYINAEIHINKGLSIRQEKQPANSWLLGEALLAKANILFSTDKPYIATTKKACEILNKSKGKNSILAVKCSMLLERILSKP